MTTDETAGFGPAAASGLIQLAVAYNDALDRCTQSGGANIDELMDLFADDAVRIVAGGPSQVGKDAIRESFLRRTAQYQQIVELKGIDLWGDLIVCRLERRDTTHIQQGAEHHVRVLLGKGGRIKRVIVVVDPDEDARLRGGMGS